MLPLSSRVRPMTETSRFRPTNPVKGVFYFGCLGPPIGGALLALVMFFGGDWLKAAKSHGFAEALSGLGSIVFMFSAWSYFIGLLPAVVTGAVAGLFRGRLMLWRYCLAIGALGAILSVVPALLLSNTRPDSGDSMLPALALCGLISGTLVARIFSMRDRPNYSLKRTDQSLRD